MSDDTLNDEVDEIIENRSKHRTFVHDLANDLTIADGSISKVLRLLGDADFAEDSVELVKLNKAKARVRNMITKLKDYRSFIHTIEDKDE
jgi:protein subunit release factor A